MSSLEVSETHLDITRNALVKNASACVHAPAKHTLLAAEGQMEKMSREDLLETSRGKTFLASLEFTQMSQVLGEKSNFYL